MVCSGLKHVKGEAIYQHSNIIITSELKGDTNSSRIKKINFVTVVDDTNAH